MDYLLLIKVNPYLVTTKPTHKQPGAVCRTTESFFVDKNILITRLPVNKNNSLLYTDDILCLDLLDK